MHQALVFVQDGILKLLNNDHEGRSPISGVNDISHFHGDRPRDIDYGTSMTEAQRTLDLASWEQCLEQYTPVYEDASSHASMTSTQPDTIGISLQQDNLMKDKSLATDIAGGVFGYPLTTQSNWQVFMLVVFHTFVMNHLVCI